MFCHMLHIIRRGKNFLHEIRNKIPKLSHNANEMKKLCPNVPKSLQYGLTNDMAGFFLHCYPVS